MPFRTSQTHPLTIATVPADRGALGMAFCPGKHQPDSLLRSWRRDLDLDLEVVRRWNPAAVITLLELQELQRLEVPDLGERIEGLGIDWYPVPVADTSVPRDAALARWRYSLLRTQRLLETGHRVLVHGNSGLGRTGMAAAHLLVALGHGSDTAIRRVREALPGAIETAQQERWVRGLHTPTAKELEQLERTLACLVGGAVGDGFGYAIEFDRMWRIRNRFGERGLQEPVLHDSELRVSDDTQLTMFTVEGLIRALKSRAEMGQVPLSVWHAYRRWLDTQGVGPELRVNGGWLVEEPSLRHQRAPGDTCVAALRDKDPPARHRARNDSKRCGGVMRVAPVGLLPRLLDGALAFPLATDLAGLTHGHPTGHLAAGAMAAIVRRLLTGAAPRRAVDEALRRLTPCPGHGETAKALITAMECVERREVDPDEVLPRLGHGWVAHEALAIGVWAAFGSDSFSETIRRAANHGGDSDSTASIAAQLFGAAHGLSTLPQAWVQRLDVLDPLLILACDLHATNQKGSAVETIRPYPLC